MLNSLKQIKRPVGRLAEIGSRVGSRVSTTVHPNNNDKEALCNFQNGDMASFSILYSRFHKPILKYVLKQIQIPNVAEELTQDVFLKVYQFRSSYNSEYEVSTWIWTIARNTVYDYLRRARSNMTAMEHTQPDHETSEWELALQETAESIMIEEFDKRKLLDLMTVLSSKQKEAIFLRLVKKFSYQEISKSMNLSLSAVKSLINRGKTAMIKLNSEPNST
jgi:RNA polymerase sigma-70 factor (ECF subfamily)